jgi:hypothetical protein
VGIPNVKVFNIFPVDIGYILKIGPLSVTYDILLVNIFRVNTNYKDIGNPHVDR